MYSAGSYQSPAGRFETLQKNPDNTWKLIQAHGDQYQFDVLGRLSAIKDRNGNTITLSYSLDQEPVYGKSPFSLNPNNLIVLSKDYRLTQIMDTTGRVLSFQYNAKGLLEKVTDGPREVKFVYDTNTNDLLALTKPATVQFPQGVTKSFEYQDHNVKRIKDFRSQYFVENFYDTQGRVKQQNLGGTSMYFDYSVANQVVETDRKEFISKYTMSAQGNVTKKEQMTANLRVDDPASFVTNYTYNTDMLLTSLIYPKGNGIKYVYDSSNSDFKKRGNLLQIRQKTNMASADNDTNDLVGLMTYESNFNQIKTSTDPKGNVTTHTYDYELPTNDPHYGTKGDEIYIDLPSVVGGAPRIEKTYNTYGQVTEVKDANGNITQYEYFPTTGYFKKIKRDPAGINAITQLTYDAFGYLDQVTDANNHITNYDFNELGWLIQEKNPRNYLTKYTHDENGNVTKVERQANAGAAQWQKVETTYDILNHPKTIKDPLNRITTYNYDNNENLSSIVDAENHTTTYDYDERNKLFKVTDANNSPGVTQYDYDINGNLAKISDANSHATNYAYDLFDRKASETFADGKVYSYAYDKNSNLTDLTKPSTAPAVTINYAYDALNRLTGKLYPAHPSLNATYAYDLSSRLVDANVTGASNHFTYDPLNRLQSNTQTIASLIYNLGYEYDKAGNRTKVTYPSGKNIVYKYDVNDNMDLVNAGFLPIVDYTYDTLDRRTIRAFPSSVPAPSSVMRDLYQYDLANQLTDLKNNAVSDVLIAQYAYPTYDNAGNRKQMQTSGVPGAQTINYTYNNIYELTGVTGSQTHSYAYDNVANRLTADGTTYVPNTVNQYTQVGTTNYTYDLNGNLTYDGVNTYTYDEENRQTTANRSGMSAQYAYDAFNRRIAKTVNGTTTYFINDGDREIEERTAAGALSADYAYGNSIDEVLTMTRGGTTYFYHYDGLGSVTELTNVSGTNVVENYTYDPYGTPSVSTSTIGNPFRYTGRRFDEESGNYYYRARMYSPGIGGFMQRDPVGYYDSMNLHTYTSNNPVNFIDPTGEFADIAADVGFIGYDLYRLASDHANGCKSNLGENLAALGGDILGAVLPGVTGVGLAIREANVGKKTLGKILTGFTGHGINRTIERGVRPKEILDAIRNPTQIKPGRNEVIRYIGKHAEVRINSKGEVVSAIRFKDPNAP